MVALGLVLLLVGGIGGVLVAWLALGSDTGVTLSMTALQVTVLPITLFASGAISMLLLWLGARVFAAGARRRAAQRRELKELRRETDVRPGATPPSGERGNLDLPRP